MFPVTDGEENTDFQEAAGRAGVTLPTPVRTRAGAVIETIEGSRWRVYHWLHSGPPLAAPVSAKIAGAVGEILASIHALRFPVAGICPWSSIRFATMSWTELTNLAAAEGAGWAPLLAAAVPTMAGLEALGDGAATSEPVLCHNNLNPGNVLLGPGGQPIVTGWEHANGLPPEWELSAALASWAVNPNGGINASGARALLEGYRRRAGSLPALSIDTFRGAATGLQNYVAGQVSWALNATGKHDQRDADRSVRHLLTHLPSVQTYARVLDAALTGTAADDEHQPALATPRCLMATEITPDDTDH